MIKNDDQFVSSTSDSLSKRIYVRVGFAYGCQLSAACHDGTTCFITLSALAMKCVCVRHVICCILQLVLSCFILRNRTGDGSFVFFQKWEKSNH